MSNIQSNGYSVSHMQVTSITQKEMLATHKLTIRTITCTARLKDRTGDSACFSRLTKNCFSKHTKKCGEQKSYYTESWSQKKNNFIQLLSPQQRENLHYRPLFSQPLTRSDLSGTSNYAYIPLAIVFRAIQSVYRLIYYLPGSQRFPIISIHFETQYRHVLWHIKIICFE